MSDLEGVKVGDEVCYGAGWGPPVIVRVERITPSGMIVAGGYRFRADGREVGGDTWHSKQLHRVEQGDRDEIEKHRLLSKARELRDNLRVANDVPVERLRAIVAVLGPIVAQQKVPS